MPSRSTRNNNRSSSSSSSVPSGRGVKRESDVQSSGYTGKEKKRLKTDEDVDAFLQKGATTATSRRKKPLGSPFIMVEYDQLTVSYGEDQEEAPTAQTTEDEWESFGYLCSVGNKGSVGPIYFPVCSTPLTEEGYQELTREQQARCLWDQQTGQWFHHPRHLVNHEVEGGATLMGHYSANSVRWAEQGELPNCRFMLDWDWKPEDPLADRVILVSIKKVEKIHEWKADRHYSARKADEHLAEEDEQVSGDGSQSETGSQLSGNENERACQRAGQRAEKVTQAECHLPLLLDGVGKLVKAMSSLGDRVGMLNATMDKEIATRKSQSTGKMVGSVSYAAALNRVEKLVTRLVEYAAEEAKHREKVAQADETKGEK